MIETTGAYLHTVAGVGTDTFGSIKILTGSPTEEMVQQTIDGDCAGRVLVGGTAGGDAIRAAATMVELATNSGERQLVARANVELIL